jgi:hypothetical protein
MTAAGLSCQCEKRDLQALGGVPSTRETPPVEGIF